MTDDIWKLAFLATVIATAILGWQSYRHYRIAACVDGGGHWDKAHGACRDRPIILHRDLYRS
jgi:hypothetical protein